MIQAVTENTDFAGAIRPFSALDPFACRILSLYQSYRPELVFDANRVQPRIYSVNSRVSYEGILAEMDNDKTISQESKDYIIHNVLNGRWFSDGLDAKYGNASLWEK